MFASTKSNKLHRLTTGEMVKVKSAAQTMTRKVDVQKVMECEESVRTRFGSELSASSFHLRRHLSSEVQSLSGMFLVSF